MDTDSIERGSIRAMTDLGDRAAARLGKLQEFAARRHLHLISTGRGAFGPAEATIPADEFDALGLAGMDRVRLADWLIVARGTLPMVEVSGPPVPAGARCDDCGVDSPPSLIAWPVEERWSVELRHGEMSAPKRQMAGPMLCEFCDELRRRLDR